MLQGGDFRDVKFGSPATPQQGGLSDGTLALFLVFGFLRTETASHASRPLLVPESVPACGRTCESGQEASRKLASVLFGGRGER